MQMLTDVCSDKGMFPSSLTAFAGTTISGASAPPTRTTLSPEKKKGTSVFVLMSVRSLTFWFSQRHRTPVVPCAKGERPADATETWVEMLEEGRSANAQQFIVI